VRRGLSLRAQLTVVVALIAALPNVVLVVAVWLPSVWSHGTLPPGAWNTVGVWLGGVVVLSAAVGYLGSGGSPATWRRCRWPHAGSRRRAWP
jgi:hypothetical protein